MRHSYTWPICQKSSSYLRTIWIWTDVSLGYLIQCTRCASSSGLSLNEFVAWTISSTCIFHVAHDLSPVPLLQEPANCDTGKRRDSPRVKFILDERSGKSLRVLGRTSCLAYPRAEEQWLEEKPHAASWYDSPDAVIAGNPDPCIAISLIFLLDAPHLLTDMFWQQRHLHHRIVRGMIGPCFSRSMIDREVISEVVWYFHTDSVCVFSRWVHSSYLSDIKCYSHNWASISLDTKPVRRSPVSNNRETIHIMLVA